MEYQNVRKTILSLYLFCSATLPGIAQQISVKTNVLYDATASINAGIEFSMGRKWTLDVSGNYNAWDFSNNKKWRHILVQPELRYWLCEKMNGHFLGAHAHWTKFNIGNVDMPFGLWKETAANRFEGDLWGGGFTYGYAYPLSRHFNMEAVVGIGYARVIFDKYPGRSCGTKILSDKKNYFGPTKLAINLVYVF